MCLGRLAFILLQVGSFKPGQYFEEKYFWEKANVRFPVGSGALCTLRRLWNLLSQTECLTWSNKFVKSLRAVEGRHAKVGPFFLLLFFTPTLYRSFKAKIGGHGVSATANDPQDFYWTQQLRKLSTEEVISDRYDWLRQHLRPTELQAVCLRRLNRPCGK